jgi:thermitase
MQTGQAAEYQAAVAEEPVIESPTAVVELGLNQLWSQITTERRVLVAVLDTGVESDHEDLAGQVVGQVNLTASDTVEDLYGHGTHIAGIIAAKDNDLGITGIAPEASLLNVKVADDRGRCDTADLVAGIIWAVDNGADVINISIEIKNATPELAQAVAYAWDNGALIIAAAGNNGSNQPVFPAYYETTLAVAAVTPADTLAPLSNWGDWVDLAAPGYKIYSTYIGNTYDCETGTSFATAYASGIAVLLFGVAQDTNGDGFINDEVREMIEAGCRDIGIDGTGAGCLDAAGILALIG